MPVLWGDFLDRLCGDFRVEIYVVNASVVRLVAGATPFRVLRRRVDGVMRQTMPISELADSAVVAPTMIRSFCCALRVPLKEFGLDD